MNNINTYDKSFPVSWEEIHRNSKALAWRLSELEPYKSILDYWFHIPFAMKNSNTYSKC